MDKKVEIAKLIRERRESLGISMSQLAEKAGISLSHVGRIEKGERFPSATILRRLARPLRLPEGQLLAAAGYLTRPSGAFLPTDVKRRTVKEVLAELEAIQPVAIPIYDQGASAGPGLEASDFAYWAPPRAADRNIKGLRVRGDCLSPRIENGDVVFFDTDIKPEDGDIVVVLMDSQLMVKRFRKLKDRSLLESNEGLVEGAEASVQGVVVAVEKWIRPGSQF